MDEHIVSKMLFCVAAANSTAAGFFQTKKRNISKTLTPVPSQKRHPSFPSGSNIFSSVCERHPVVNEYRLSAQHARAWLEPPTNTATHGMKWALKFTTKGKGSGDAKKSYQGANSFRNGGESGGGGQQGGFRSSSDGEGDYGQDNERELEPGVDGSSTSRTPIVTPPDANGGGGGGAQPQAPGEKEGGESAIREGQNSAPQFTVDSAVRRGAPGEGDLDGEWDEMDEGEGGDAGVDPQADVFDDDSQDADSLNAGKAARMKSFADDPEGHALEDRDADWDGKTFLFLLALHSLHACPGHPSPVSRTGHYVRVVSRESVSLVTCLPRDPT